MSLISFLRRKSALLHLVWGWKDETLKTPVQLKKISQLNEFSRRLEQNGSASAKKPPTTLGDIAKLGDRAQPNSTVWGREGWRLILKQVGKKQRWERRGKKQPPRKLAGRLPSPWIKDRT